MNVLDTAKTAGGLALIALIALVVMRKAFASVNVSVGH